MLMTEVLRALLKFWYLVLCGVLVALGGAYYMWNHTEPRYTAEASVLLLPPASSIKGTAPNGDDSNPLMNLGGLNQARDVLISAMSSASQKEAFDQAFSNTAYTVGVDPLSSGPILVIKTDSERAAEASQSLEFLLGQFSERLVDMQVDLAVPEKSSIESIQLTPPTTPEADAKPQLRAAALTGVGALVATVLLIALIDGLLRYARRSKQRRENELGKETGLEVQPVGAKMIDDKAPEPNDFWEYDSDDFEAVHMSDETRTGGPSVDASVRTGAP